MSIEEEEELSLAEDSCDEIEYGEDRADNADGRQRSVKDSGERRSLPGNRELGSGPYNAREVNDQVFEELILDETVIDQVNFAWRAFLKSCESKEAAGEAIYAAIFDSAPSLQGLFKTPRAVQSMRFMSGLNAIANGLRNPKAFKGFVETLGFQHLDMEVTIPRIVLFRDALTDLIKTELGHRFTPKAMEGWMTALNYVGGSFIYVRENYAEHLKVLAESWAQANNKEVEAMHVQQEGEGSEEHNGEAEVPVIGGNEPQGLDMQCGGQKAKQGKKGQAKEGGRRWRFGVSPSGKTCGGGPERGDSTGDSDGVQDLKDAAIPRSFQDMCMFNAAVMGYGSSGWIQEVLSSFDSIVTNASNSSRLQEECEVLCLRLAKYRGTINLSEYKSVMLASLRSLIKEWGSVHETSWSWLWENVERILKSLIGKPQVQEVALAKLLSSFDESILMSVRREIYEKFFEVAPAGQDHFKQSTGRLYFIADRVIALSLEMYREPRRMADDLSALGLRHVGYGIPTDMFPPFVTCCVQVMRAKAQDQVAADAFSWSLTLISRILQRVISEGSTVVMQAINANSGKQLKKAVACAPRGQRALWVLNVHVGTQSISPFMWAIETGSFDAAKAIIVDLMTIRADRDRYYYGMDLLFERHPDIIKRLCADAPAMLPKLLDGLIWRSRATTNGMRRVNYYIKHFIVDADGDFSKAIESIVDFHDPNIACHSVVSLVTDLVWSRIAMRRFLCRKTWFLCTLIVWLFSQSILDDLDIARIEAWDKRVAEGLISEGEHFQHSFHVRLLGMLGKGFIYIGIIGQWLSYHTRWTMHSIRRNEVVRLVGGHLKLPAYLGNWQDAASLCLVGSLIAMVFLDPMWRCWRWTTELFDEHCPAAESWTPIYNMIATLVTIVYFLLLTDLAVLSTRVSAFALVFGRVISEVALFLFALAFFVLAFASAISSLEHEDPSFSGIPTSSLSLFRISLGMFSGEQYDGMTKFPSLFIAIFIFGIITVIFLLNLLIAQLNCAYQATYQDMLGYARLNRGKIITETMLSVTRKRWEAFVESLRLDERIEFGEGDIGLAGGIQVLEPAGANITTVDTIRRFGGTTSPAAQWPQDDAAGDEETDRFDRLEKLIERSMKRLVGQGGRGKGSIAGGSIVGHGSSVVFTSDGSSGGGQESVSE